MFYCDPCAEEYDYPHPTLVRSRGRCECCGIARDCNDLPSKDLPLPKRESRELALLLDNGTVIRDSGWRCIADVLGSFHGFVSSGGRAYGVVVDAETLVQVYPPTQVIDGTANLTD